MEKELVTTESDYDIDAFLAKRTEFIKKVNGIMVEKQDFHVIQGKKSLGKGGAEKIASIFGWQAEFVADQDTLKMFGNVTGLVAYICNLTKNKEFVGQGRGAANVGKNQGDPNKTVKMAQKSAFVDAVLRSSGLSDFFTQDIEDMDFEPQTAPQTKKTYPTGNVQLPPKTTPTASNLPSSEAPKGQLDTFMEYMGYIGEAKDEKELNAIGEEIKKLTLSTAQKAALRGKYKARKEVLTPVDTTPDYAKEGFFPEEK